MNTLFRRETKRFNFLKSLIRSRKKRNFKFYAYVERKRNFISLNNRNKNLIRDSFDREQNFSLCCMQECVKKTN